MTFAASFPAWTGADGFPLSWRHYVHGMRFLGRAMLRRQLEHAEAVRMAGAVPDDFRAFQRDTQRMTEVPRDG